MHQCDIMRIMRIIHARLAEERKDDIRALLILHRAHGHIDLRAVIEVDLMIENAEHIFRRKADDDRPLGGVGHPFPLDLLQPMAEPRRPFRKILRLGHEIVDRIEGTSDMYGKGAGFQHGHGHSRKLHTMLKG